jgi:hypothetical protein
MCTLTHTTVKQHSLTEHGPTSNPKRNGVKGHRPWPVRPASPDGGAGRSIAADPGAISTRQLADLQQNRAKRRGADFICTTSMKSSASLTAPLRRETLPLRTNRNNRHPLCDIGTLAHGKAGRSSCKSSRPSVLLANSNQPCASISATKTVTEPTDMS